MPLYADLTREVRRGTRGPKVGAFFDVDRTLLAGFSSVIFMRQQLLSGRLAPRDLWHALSATASFGLGRIGFSGFVTGAMGMLRGVSESALDALGEQIFEDQLAREVYPEARALVLAHRRMGHTLAVVSSATRFQVEPLARELGIDNVLCTDLETRDGIFTGRVLKPTCYREGKAEAARELALLLGVDLGESYFYTDSDDDLPLLEIVGNPRPTNPNRNLTGIATERGWPVRRFTSRGTPGPEEFLRTALVIGSIVPSFFFGLPVALLNRTRRQGVNLGITAFGELASAIAGLSIEIEGEEHLWSRRPAVFVFNHQSAIDVLLLCKLLRRDVVSVAPTRARWHPLYGPLLSLIGAVFIDGFHDESGDAPLADGVQALRQGLSVVAPPEGSSSPSARLGEFRPAAFRLAMEAGVPVVPIVFRNTADALPKGATVIRPLAIEVVIHPPIQTDAWNAETLDREIEKIHELYVETLGA